MTAISSERDALLRAILANPAEDTPRLVFADWCDENGEPERAAAIRNALTPGRMELGHHFRDDVNELARLGSIRAALDRGFVFELDATASVFMGNAGRIFRKHPITRVRLAGRMPLRRGPRSFVWFTRKGIEDLPGEGWSYYVPHVLHLFFREYRGKDQRGLSSRVVCRRFPYPTLEKAEFALGDACVRYGRWLAGLPVAGVK